MIRGTVLLMLLVMTLTVQAEVERHALVIGNSSYDPGALTNPKNDAKDIASVLRDLGFKVHKNGALYDLTLDQFQRELEAYRAVLPRLAMSVVYYAGHGLSWRGDNYLMPIDAKIGLSEQLNTEAVSLQGIVNRMNSRNRSGVNIFLLDACRDSPLNRQVGSEGEGLVRLKALPHNTFIGYAAQEGKVVSDGEGRNGLYTQELIKALRDAPNQSIEALHDTVEFNVFDRSRQDGLSQIPMAHETVTDNYCFGQCEEGGVLSRTIDSTPVVLPEETKTKRNILFVVLGAVAVAVLASVVGGNDDESSDTVLLTLTPPEP